MPSASTEKRPNRTELKSRRVSYTLPAAVAVSLLAAACGTPDRSVTPTTPTTSTAASEDPTNVAVCVDPKTSVRVPDDQCKSTTSPYRHFWYPHTPDLLYPAIGAAILLSAGTFIRPTTGRLRDSGVPASGGKILRGGFGKSSNESSSGS
ncbi:hypothetical protein [Nocardia sp. NPDC051832]|uniref:hypothetical protein n=1 Tax=Nocardia sp. NPDC051832 TaxID=3155673 RepID=UPI00342E6640